VYDNLALLPRPWHVCLGGSVWLAGLGSLYRFKLLLIPLVEESRDAQAECPCLRPAAVGQRRVVGRRRGEMPCLVGGIETRAVSGRGLTVAYFVSGDANLATTTTAGPLAMAANKMTTTRSCEASQYYGRGRCVALPTAKDGGVCDQRQLCE
jgi:hypothetical protein